MSVLAVDPADLMQAAGIYTTAYEDACLAVTRMLGTLNGCSGAMAGSDAGGLQWARSYDSAVGQVVDASSYVLNGLNKMSGLVRATGANHAQADAASVVGGSTSPYPTAGEIDTFNSESSSAPPSASGGSTAEPDGWHWVADLMEYTWPNGHQDQLNEAAQAWNAAASALQAQVVPGAYAASWLVADVNSPEIPLVDGYCQQMIGHVNDLSAGFTSLGAACSGYATHLDNAHHTIISELKSFIEWTVGLEVGGGLLSIVTLGASELAANAVVIAKATALAARVGGIISDLIETVGTIVQAIIDAMVEITNVVARLRALVNLKIAAAVTKISTKAVDLAAVVKIGKGAADIGDATAGRELETDIPGEVTDPGGPGGGDVPGVTPNEQLQKFLDDHPTFEARTADNGKGTVYQDPGAPGNAGSVRVMDPTAQYPNGYVRFYNDEGPGQPITLDGKPGSKPDTHFPIDIDGNFPFPKGF